MRKTCAKPVDAPGKIVEAEHNIYPGSYTLHNHTMDNSPTFHQKIHTDPALLSTLFLQKTNLLLSHLSTLYTGPIINTKRNIHYLNTYY